MGRLRGMAVSLSEHVKRLPVVTINLIATHFQHMSRPTADLYGPKSAGYAACHC